MSFFLLFLVNIIKIIKYAILIRVLMSWIQVNPSASWVKFIYEATEPILGSIRKILPRTGMIDLAPLAAFFMLDVIEMMILKSVS